MIFVLGFFAGRIITTIQIGIRYNEMVKKMREKYESRKAQKNEKKLFSKSRKLAKRGNQ